MNTCNHLIEFKPPDAAADDSGGSNHHSTTEWFKVFESNPNTNLTSFKEIIFFKDYEPNQQK